MITPKFTVTQTEETIKISVHAPYTNVKDTEISVEDDDVRFYSKPYYLRIKLPGKVEETDHSSAKYLCDEALFEIELQKVTKGEHFEGLNLITQLLMPKGGENQKRTKPLIEVMQDPTTLPSESMAMMTDTDWFIDQVPSSSKDEEAKRLASCSQFGYGFGGNHRGLGTKYEVELGEIAEIKNPDAVSPPTRFSMKNDKEQKKFSNSHYLNDLLMETEIPQVLEFQFDSHSLRHLSDANYEQMKNLGNREFLLDKDQQKKGYLGLVDIIFSYCYDWRINEGEHTVESAWNISRVSSTLSWFVTFDYLRAVIISCLRRSLSYPLMRNWQLTMKVFEDVVQVFKAGREGVLICLLDIFKMFNARDPYYLLNQLYIHDYCVWIQQVPQENISSLVDNLERELAQITKDHAGFELVELEVAARIVEDEEMEEELTADIQNLGPFDTKSI